ncbi:hypothetical protein TRVL_04352 [Trypanosoma vivax]|nr:hypothetical protein TRVL_04352 [Trypanosoma vivax]
MFAIPRRLQMAPKTNSSVRRSAGSALFMTVGQGGGRGTGAVRDPQSARQIAHRASGRDIKQPRQRPNAHVASRGGMLRDKERQAHSAPMPLRGGEESSITSQKEVRQHTRSIAAREAMGVSGNNVRPATQGDCECKVLKTLRWSGAALSKGKTNVAHTRERRARRRRPDTQEVPVGLAEWCFCEMLSKLRLTAALRRGDGRKNSVLFG